MADYNRWHGLESCSSQNFSCASVLKPVIIRIDTDEIVLISRPDVGHFSLGCFDPDISATKKTNKGGVSAITINCGLGCVNA